MKTEISNGITWLTCCHAEKFAKATAKEVPPPLLFQDAAPPLNGIELEPGVLFFCCAWCASHLRQEALNAFVKDGIKVTFEPTTSPKNDHHH